jgi:cell division protein FtsN
MFRWTLLSGVALCCAATQSVAQAPARPLDPVFVRAQTLVSDGNGPAGRALIDSVIAVTPPTARLYPEALFWRASLAANAADAESDYRHIVVDYPLAPQAEAALLRLAQLELARGDRDGALRHLQRIGRDYPSSKSLARASYWIARVFFEKNDIANACAANANALSQAGTSEVELRNQIRYQGQRCPAPVVATVDSPATSVAKADSPTTNATANSVVVASSSAPKLDSVSTVTTTASTTPKTIASTTPTPPTPVKTTDSALRPKPSTEANDSKPGVVDPTEALKASISKPASKPVAKSAVPASRGSGYSVQVAAFTDSKADADKLASSLIKRGYSARVDGTIAPFRVRIGRYSTAKEAEDALRKIKPKFMDAFVVRAPER